MEIDVTGEDVRQLGGHRIRNFGVVGCGKQRALNHAARHARAGTELAAFQARAEARVGLRHHQALEFWGVVTCPAGAEAQQLVMLIGFGRDQPTSLAQQGLASLRVIADKGGGYGIRYPQATQQ